jgi:hypothetical protein
MVRPDADALADQRWSQQFQSIDAQVDTLRRARAANARFRRQALEELERLKAGGDPAVVSDSASLLAGGGGAPAASKHVIDPAAGRVVGDVSGIVGTGATLVSVGIDAHRAHQMAARADRVDQLHDHLLDLAADDGRIDATIAGLGADQQRLIDTGPEPPPVGLDGVGSPGALQDDQAQSRARQQALLDQLHQAEQDAHAARVAADTAASHRSGAVVRATRIEADALDPIPAAAASGVAILAGAAAIVFPPAGAACAAVANSSTMTGAFLRADAQRAAQTADQIRTAAVRHARDAGYHAQAAADAQRRVDTLSDQLTQARSHHARLRDLEARLAPDNQSLIRDD